MKVNVKLKINFKRRWVNEGVWGRWAAPLLDYLINIVRKIGLNLD